MRRSLERMPERPRSTSIGVDTWGCDYALLGERGSLLQNPYHYRDSRTDGVMEVGLPAGSGRRDLRDHRHPVPAVQHALSALRGIAARRRRLLDAAQHVR